jgi:hypothetical protein
MNKGQEKFYEYILECVKPEYIMEAKALLNESFNKQNEGTFNQAYLDEFMSKMLSILKVEKIEEVEAIMVEFGERLK